MLLDYVSDLHLDNGMLSTQPLGWLGRFDFSRYKCKEAEVLVVAGDTANHARDAADFLIAAATHYRYVVAVDGNHERCNPAQPELPEYVHLLDQRREHMVLLNGVAFVGGCLALEEEDAMATVVAAVEAANHDPAIKAVIVVSHYVPTAAIGDLIGGDICHKANDLLSRLPKPTKPSVIVFGHLHIEIDTVIDGWRLVSNPRGYRARRRDGTTWSGFQQIEI